VTESLLEKVNAGRSAPADYVPDYLVSSYVPRDADEAQCINAANAIVGNEPWYKERVAGHAHDGLAF